MQSKSTFLEFLRGINGYKFGPPKKFFKGEIIQDEWRNLHQAHALYLREVLTCVLVCFLVEFDLLVAFGVLSCRILDCAFLFIYVHEHDRLCFPMLTEETAVLFWSIAFVDLVQVATEKVSLLVEYCFELVEGYSECTIHQGEPEPRKGNVNTVYFINQARANTQISRMEFMYDESMQLQMVTYIWASCLE